MKNNLKHSSLMERSQLVLCGLLAAGLQICSTHAAVILNVDLGDRPLVGNTAGQTVDLYIDNIGDTTLQASGLTFVLQLVGGGGISGPSVTAVNVLTGTPWQGLTLLANPQSQGPALWDLRYVDISGGYAELAAGSHTKLATVTFDTTGFESGSWALTFGGTKYNQFLTGTEFFPTFTSGQINVSAVPEPVDVALPIFGGLAVLIGGVRRWCRQKASAG